MIPKPPKIALNKILNIVIIFSIYTRINLLLLSSYTILSKHYDFFPSNFKVIFSQKRRFLKREALRGQCGYNPSSDTNICIIMLIYFY